MSRRPEAQTPVQPANDLAAPLERGRTRRAMLAGLAGGAAAFAASSLGRAAPALAADGNPVILGTSSNISTTGTIVQSTTQDVVVFTSFAGNANGSGIGMQGESPATNGKGVRGIAGSGRGVEGQSTSGRGVHGESSSGWGVYGRSSTSRGVVGVGPAASGIGVYGESSAGVALSGNTVTGYALQTNGRLKVDKVSGVASIAAGKTSVTVTPGVDVTSSSFVLLTPRANIGSRGLWFTLDTTNKRFVIRLSSSRSSSTKVSWLLLG